MTQVAFSLVDSMGQIALVNPAWERLTGFGCEQAASATLSLLIGDLTDLRQLRAVVEAYRDTHLPAEASVFLYRKVHSACFAQ